MASRWGCCWLALVVLPLLGCGPSLPETAVVHGTVTYRGEPVKQGRIAFYPTEGRSAQGVLNARGEFSLTTFTPEDGALLGSHRVTITAFQSAGTFAPVRWLVPQKYSVRTTTPLTCEVARGENTFHFDLPAEP